MTANTPKWHAQEIHDAHALAIGRVAIAWNEMHEYLAEIFAYLFEDNDYGLALTSWHALTNDGAQREMLRSVAEVKLSANSKAYKEINWVLDQIKTRLLNQRNTGIHMPLMIFTEGSPNNKGQTQILPLGLYGNRKASAMVGKDLLKEYGHYEKQIRKVSTYIIAISFNVSRSRIGPESWPQRPDIQPHAPK